LGKAATEGCLHRRFSTTNRPYSECNNGKSCCPVSTEKPFKLSG